MSIDIHCMDIYSEVAKAMADHSPNGIVSKAQTAAHGAVLDYLNSGALDKALDKEIADAGGTKWGIPTSPHAALYMGIKTAVHLMSKDSLASSAGDLVGKALNGAWSDITHGKSSMCTSSLCNTTALADQIHSSLNHTSIDIGHGINLPTNLLVTEDLIKTKLIPAIQSAIADNLGVTTNQLMRLCEDIVQPCQPTFCSDGKTKADAALTCKQFNGILELVMKKVDILGMLNKELSDNGFDLVLTQQNICAALNKLSSDQLATVTKLAENIAASQTQTPELTILTKYIPQIPNMVKCVCTNPHTPLTCSDALYVVNLILTNPKIHSVLTEKTKGMMNLSDLSSLCEGLYGISNYDPKAISEFVFPLIPEPYKTTIAPYKDDLPSLFKCICPKFGHPPVSPPGAPVSPPGGTSGVVAPQSKFVTKNILILATVLLVPMIIVLAVLIRKKLSWITVLLVMGICMLVGMGIMVTFVGLNPKCWGHTCPSAPVTDMSGTYMGVSPKTFGISVAATTELTGKNTVIMKSLQCPGCPNGSKDLLKGCSDPTLAIGKSVGSQGFELIGPCFAQISENVKKMTAGTPVSVNLQGLALHLDQEGLRLNVNLSISGIPKTVSTVMKKSD